MLRFLPDDWLDGLLRPFLLADPAIGLYLEVGAPDWRFAALALLLLAACWGRRRLALLQPNQRAALLGLWSCFYVWTFASGNGRYFIWGLLLAGPLVVVAARELAASRFMRNAVIVVVLLIQVVSAALSYRPNGWSIRPWHSGPGLALEPHSMSSRPAVYLTLGNISYSVLVPQLHPQSRWVNLVGQMELDSRQREYPALQEAISGPLPIYAVLRATPFNRDVDLQPSPKAKHSLAETLARHGFARSTPSCEYVRTLDAVRSIAEGDPSRDDGFWFCPLQRSGNPPPSGALPAVAPEVDDVFARVEQRCPVFFPPGQARSRRIDGAVMRWYVYSETRLYVDDSGEVYFQWSRALNPTTIATIDEIRRDRFTIDCTHLPGRYLPPWRRD